MKMKNKKAEQEKKRQADKARRAAAKRKRAAGTKLERADPKKQKKESFLIVCEGKNTEPSYFEQFKLSTAVITVVGEGYNTLSLVKEAKRLSEKKKGEKYDQVWCVFDKDDFPANNFNQAIALSEKLGFKVAYSNQAFEYWLILHFEAHQGGAMHRDSYCAKLNSYLKAFNLK